jgi:hypothetical protein
VDLVAAEKPTAPVTVIAVGAIERMMKTETIINTSLFGILSAIPLVAEYITAMPRNVPGTGFDVLIYEPFDYAYFLMAIFLFMGANIASAYKQKKPIMQAIVFGGAISIAWFITSFIAVAQLHNSLGGKL